MPLRLFVFSFLLLLLSPGTSKAAPEDCPYHDFRARFGPIRDQDGLNYCYSFVASALAGEALCLEKRQLCGVDLAPLDTASCETGYSSIYEGKAIQGRSYVGSTITSALQCFVSRGTCRETAAPFVPACKLLDVIYKDKICLDTQALKNYFDEQEKRCGTPEESKNDLGFFSQLLSSMMPKAGLAAKAQEMNEAMLHSRDWPTFLSNVLVPPKCRADRLKLQSQRKVFTEVYPENYPEVLSELYPGEAGEKLVNQTGRPVAARIIDRLNEGRSIGVGLCLNKLSMKYDVKFKGPCPMRHAVIVNGSRWNPHKNRCEVHLRNSLGARAEFNGWFDLNKIGNATFLIDQIH